MWQIIEENKRKSWFLFFSLGAIMLTMGYVFGFYYGDYEGGTFGLIMAMGLWLILSTVAYFQGDNIMLAVAGAKEVTSENYPQLYNIVEEMKIAGNLPALPKIYIIEDQNLNAFATGIRPEKSAVAITRGLLEKLNRDEIQGVMAHEVGHIINRDVLFMTLAGIMIGCIAMMSDMFWRNHLWGGGRKKSSSNNDSKGEGALVVVAVVLAILAPIFARILYFAASKKREYLADAEAVRLTRNPLGLALALEKISLAPVNKKNINQVVAPLYIVNPLANLEADSLFTTHPPVKNRIKILKTLSSDVDYHAYQNAYNQQLGNKDVLIKTKD